MALTLTNAKRTTLLESLMRRSISQGVPASLTVVCQNIINLVGGAGDAQLAAEATRLVADLNATIVNLQADLITLNDQVTSDNSQLTNLQAQITSLTS